MIKTSLATCTILQASISRECPDRIVHVSGKVLAAMFSDVRKLHDVWHALDAFRVGHGSGDHVCARLTEIMDRED